MNDINLFKSGFRVSRSPMNDPHPDEGQRARCLSCYRIFVKVMNGSEKFCPLCKVKTKVEKL